MSKLAIGPWPTSSRVAVVAPILASPSTSTSRRASDDGRAGPVACHVPPPDAKIPTVPGRSWFPALRLYAPLEPYFDQSWPLPDIEKVK